MSDKQLLKKFATQVEDTLLTELRRIARQDGRKVQALVGDALSDYILRYKQGLVRTDVIKAFTQSNREFGGVYKSLIHQD
jgi:hypothetical protein